MALIRRTWTPKEADNWTKEDVMAIIISPITYILLTLGVAFSALLMPIGFILFFLGVALTLFMAFIINPKLSTISDEYEKKQKHYIEDLEKQVKWESPED